MKINRNLSRLDVKKKDNKENAHPGSLLAGVSRPCGRRKRGIGAALYPGLRPSGMTNAAEAGYGFSCCVILQCFYAGYSKVRRGFTLIELLVVVLIIAILAAVALPQYQKAVVQARLSEATSQLKKLEQATDLWLVENGEFPSSVVQFLGTSPQAQLPFTIPGKAVGNTVQTSTFVYTTYCGNGFCDHIVDRTNEYRLFQRKYNNAYMRQCEVRDNNSKEAHLICDEMKKKGWAKVIR